MSEIPFIIAAQIRIGFAWRIGKPFGQISLLEKKKFTVKKASWIWKLKTGSANFPPAAAWTSE